MTAGPFRLYPVEQHWCSFNDYGVVLSTVQRLGARRILEFGPGWSTLALIEGGADWIDACEDDPHYFARYVRLIEDRFPAKVAMRGYTYRLPLYVPYVDGRYDLAVIDGPRDTDKRPAVVEYALECADAVLVPLEEGENDGGILRDFIATRPRDCSVEWIEDAGPLAGAWALLRGNDPSQSGNA